MLRLILTRHAKSSWESAATSDHDRPLNDRGRQAARALGAWMASRDYIPAECVTSSAVRTVETREGIARSMPPGITLRSEARLYNAGPDALLAEVQKARGETLLVIAHNPGIAEFAQLMLTSPPPSPDFRKYPSGATTVIDFQQKKWAEVEFHLGQFREFITPKAL